METENLDNRDDNNFNDEKDDNLKTMTVSEIAKSEIEYMNDMDKKINNNQNIEVITGENIQANLSFKVIIIGDSFVGKSCLANKAVKNIFDTSYSATLGFDCFSFFVKIDKKIIKLQIWDTCGQEIYQSLITNFYRNSSLALMVYGINNRASFEHIDIWMKEIKRNSNPDAKIFLIGNKSDLEDERKVSYEEAKKYADDLDCKKFFETSAKSGLNAQEVFIEAANILYEDYVEYKSSSQNSSYISSSRISSKSTKNSKISESQKCC